MAPARDEEPVKMISLKPDSANVAISDLLSSAALWR